MRLNTFGCKLRYGDVDVAERIWKMRLKSRWLGYPLREARLFFCNLGVWILTNCMVSNLNGWRKVDLEKMSKKICLKGRHTDLRVLLTLQWTSKFWSTMLACPTIVDLSMARTIHLLGSKFMPTTQLLYYYFGFPETLMHWTKEMNVFLSYG